MKYILIILNLIVLSSTSANASSDLKEEITRWLDPKLYSKIAAVEEIVRDQKPREIPTTNQDEDWGFTFRPNINNSMCLDIIAMRYQKKGTRIRLVNLGAGLGYFDTLAILAGAATDLVEQHMAVAKKANDYIFTTTSKLVGYTKENYKDFYRIFPQDILGQNVTWTQTQHEIAFCDNVVHFFTPSQCDFFAKRLYENMQKEGIIFVTADTPYSNESWLKYYTQQSNKEYPGYAVYSSKRKDKFSAVETIGQPCTVEGDTLKPGKLYTGQYLKGGKVINSMSAYHNVRNLFKAKDLESMFTRQGFKAEKTYYLDPIGGTIIPAEESLKVGTDYRACVILSK